MTKIRLAILALFIISWQFIAAQVYPVQVTTQLAAPYSLYLPDYVLPGSERLVVTALLGDVSRPELNVRFRMRIEGQGIVVETKPEYIPAPISLQGGVPLRMISSDLAPYFEPRNLNFIQGLTQREFEQRGGKLPEGLYSFCFEVLEYNRGVKISNAGCANAWMILNDPPIINIPRQDEKLKPLNPQNVVIQWTPRHTGSPNSAFNTEYEVTMVEVWPSTRNPNDAMLTSPPIFQATTQSTMLIYGPAETPLEQGRRYAFRVRAKGKVGIDELDLFKNQGYSEVYSFTYGDACDLPAEISGESFTNRFNLKWDSRFNHTSFKVRYRKQGTTDWYVEKSTFNDASITSLKPSTVYEYQVAGACGWYEGDYTTVATIKTKDEPERTYSCGLPLETFNLDPSKLTGSLKVGDVIDAGDFDVELTKVTGSAGNFSGEGIVVMPMMNKVKVKAEFSNITVAGVPTATDYRMVKGFMNVTGGGIDVIPAGVLNAMDKLVETLDIVDSALTIVEAYIPKKGPDPVSFAADTLIKIDANIIAVVRDPNSGKVIVTSANGKATELAPGKNYALTDKDGTGYVVDSKGGVTKTTADVATKASQRKYNFSVQFSNVVTSAAPGGFDRYAGNTIFSSTYELLGKTYFVPWKASAQNGTGTLTAVLTDRSLDASKVTFEMIDVQATSTLVGDRWTFNITSATAGKIVAYYPSTGPGDKEQILGKVNIQGFDPKPYKLVIVKDADGKYPFTNKDVKILTDSLNRIYGQALVNWQVSYEERDFNIDKSFDAGNSGLLSNYTADMRKVISAYGTLQKDAYYLFVIDKPTNSGDVVGFMPRSQQAGFIYTNGNTTPGLFIHTAAHELGHGVFNLKHIFDEFSGLGEKSTKNLMDYTDNSSHHLMRFQWERIHDPVTVIGLFEDDEDAALVSSIALIELDDFDLNQPLTQADGACSDAKFLSYFYKFGNISVENNKRIASYALNDGRLMYIKDKDGNIYSPVRTVMTGPIEKPTGDFTKEVKSVEDPIEYCCFDCVRRDVKAKILQNVVIDDKVLNGAAATVTYKGIPAEYKITLINVSSCEEGQIVYSGFDAVTKKLVCKPYTKEDCNKVNNLLNGVGNGDGYVFNYTDEPIDDFIKQLYSGSHKKYPGHHTTVAYLFITNKDSYESKKSFIENYKVPQGAIKVWLNNENGTWILKNELPANVKSLLNAKTFEELFGLAKIDVKCPENTPQGNLYNWTEFTSPLQVGFNAIDFVATAYYELFDALSKGIRKARVPDYIWNCNDDKKYQPIYAHVYRFITLPLNVVKVPLYIAAEGLSQKFQSTNPDMAAVLHGIAGGEIEFAFMCGVWNGLIETFASVADIGKIFYGAASCRGRDDFGKFLNQLDQFKLEKEGGIPPNNLECEGTWCAIKTGLKKQFTGRCMIAEMGGEIAFIVVVSLVDPAASEALVGKSITTAIKVIQTVDVFADKLNPLGWVLRFTSKGVGVLRNKAGKVMARFVDGEFVAKAIDKAGNIIDVPRVPVDKVILETAEDGSVIAKIKGDPTEQSYKIVEGTVEVIDVLDEALNQARKEFDDHLKSINKQLNSIPFADPKFLKLFGTYAGIAMGKGVRDFTVFVNGLPADIKKFVTDHLDDAKKKFDELVNDYIDLSRIQKINGKYPINAEDYAGKTFHFDLTKNRKLEQRWSEYRYTQAEIAAEKLKLETLLKKYPNGVRFSELGYPDFSPYRLTHEGAIVEVDIGRLNPDVSGKTKGSQLDMVDANNWMKNNVDPKWRKPADYTWHHVENSTRLQLVPTDLHSAIRHNGGRSTYFSDVIQDYE